MGPVLRRPPDIAGACPQLGHLRGRRRFRGRASLHEHAGSRERRLQVLVGLGHRHMEIARAARSRRRRSQRGLHADDRPGAVAAHAQHLPRADRVPRRCARVADSQAMAVHLRPDGAVPRSLRPECGQVDTIMLIALTRAVAPSINRCELTHMARAPIDVALAVRQHEQYEAALRDAGCSIAHAAPEPDLPDSVFIEDTAVVCDEVAVVTRPGAASRRPETAAVAAALQAFRRVETIEAPGTLDGGDVLVAGRTVYVGMGARSNVEGARQLEERLSPYGYEVRPVPVNGCLHLKSAATLVSPAAVLVNPAWVDPLVFASLDSVVVDPGEPFAANALLLDDRILYSPAYPRTCLLYTSDAADDLLCVDLGGRRII